MCVCGGKSGERGGGGAREIKGSNCFCDGNFCNNSVL